MTFSVSRDGRHLGTYSEDGLERQLSNGVLLPTDLVFLENEQKWVPLSEAPKGYDQQVADFHLQMETTAPNPVLTSAVIVINACLFLAMICSGVSPLEPTNG